MLCLYTAECFKLIASFPGSIEVKGWRNELMKFCCRWVAFYETKNSISYDARTLRARLWFKTEENMLRFVNEVTASHNTFCSHLPQSDWEFSDEPEVPPRLIPVMLNHYQTSDSSSPEHSEIPYHETASSIVSVSQARVYFRLLEDVSEFFDVKPTGCHIADKALWSEYDLDKDNRLYLSQVLHSRFDGLQTTDGIPHVGIFFEEDAGEEIVSYCGASFSMSKIIVGFEIPFEGVASRIRFKPGTYQRDGTYYTSIYVNNAANVKKYLNLKYCNTCNKWASKGIEYTKKIVLEDAELEC